MAEWCLNKCHKWQKLPCHKNGLPLPFPYKWHATCHKMSESVQIKTLCHSYGRKNCQCKIALAKCKTNAFKVLKLNYFVPNLQEKYYEHLSTE